MGRRRGVSNRRMWDFGELSRAAVAAAAAAVFVPAFAGASEITSNWSGNTGNWTDPTQWTTNPNYPNNGTPAGVEYDAVINAPGAGPYTVTLNSNVTTDSVTLNSPNATLSQTGGTLTTTSLNISAGTYVLENASLQNATFTSSSTAAVNIQNSTITNSTLGLPSNGEFAFDTLVNVALASDLTTTDTTSIGGTINTAGHTINVFGRPYDTYSGDLLISSGGN